MRQALVERTQTTLRHVVGARLLQDVIERREEIAQAIREITEESATAWGVAIESMLVKDIIFSQELQDSLSMAAQSKRTGEAKVIAARAEVESAKLMRQAADILSSAPAMQIRYLEAMQAMAKTANSKVCLSSHAILFSSHAILLIIPRMVPHVDAHPPFKVIFLPAQNQTVQSQMATADQYGEGSRAHGAASSQVQSSSHDEYGFDPNGMQSASNAAIIQNI